MKLAYYVLPVVFLLLVIAAPDPVLAAPGGLVPCEGAGCTSCDVVALANNVIQWLIGILFVVFAIIAVSAGFGLVTSGGNVDAKSKAKSMMTNAIIGFIIVLASWLLIDTIMRALLTGGEGQISGFGAWSEIECVGQATPETVMDQTGVTNYTESGPIPGGNASLAAGGLTHLDALNQLSVGGVGVKPGAYLEGLRPHVIDGVTELNANCGCNIVVTEGTGGTHSTNGEFTHANGFKLDLRTRDNPQLVSYVVNSFEPAGNWSDGTKLYYDSRRCATYAIEGDHIDVVYKTGCN